MFISGIRSRHTIHVMFTKLTKRLCGLLLRFPPHAEKQQALPHLLQQKCRVGLRRISRRRPPAEQRAGEGGVGLIWVYQRKIGYFLGCYDPGVPGLFSALVSPSADGQNSPIQTLFLALISLMD